MLDVHLAQNGRPVVGNRHLSVGTHKHLVHAIRAEGGPQGVGHHPRCKDVRLGGGRVCVCGFFFLEGGGIFVLFECVHNFNKQYTSVHLPNINAIADLEQI